MAENVRWLLSVYCQSNDAHIIITPLLITWIFSNGMFHSLPISVRRRRKMSVRLVSLTVVAGGVSFEFLKYKNDEHTLDSREPITVVISPRSVD